MSFHLIIQLSKQHERTASDCVGLPLNMVLGFLVRPNWLPPFTYTGTAATEFQYLGTSLDIGAEESPDSTKSSRLVLALFKSARSAASCLT
jgi:hypothetical protein